MIRTFETHRIRKQRELTNCFWEFEPCGGEYAGEKFQVYTPSCWENHPNFRNYRGEGIYRTRFYLGGNARLEFKGVSHTATIYVDGKCVGTHYNAYSIFTVELRNLKEDWHTLEVKADNRFSEKSALHVPNDYMSYGGLSRPVVLESIEDTFIEWVHVTPKMAAQTDSMEAGTSWEAEVEVCVKNISPDRKVVDITSTIQEKVLEWKAQQIPAGENIRVRGTLAFDQVIPWSQEEPKLYYVENTLKDKDVIVDDLIDRFGFRQVTVKGKQILINGQAVKIKGLCRHEDHPQFGCALPAAAIAADLEIIKDLGANSIRTAHYPNDEVFLDMCDEQGILVWEENHARGLSLEDMMNPNFEEQAEQVIREMIPAHYNHPSIYIWGILNECASDSEYGKECYRKQFELIKQLDTSRPHSFASCKFKTDISFGLPDVVSYNIYPLWYHDTPPEEYLDDLYQWVQQDTEGAGKPFLITEIGAGAIYGCRNAYHSKWTEEYQEEALEKQLHAVLNYKDCCGVYIWQFCDIRISDEWFGGRPRTMNNKGIVDEYRRPKLSYDIVKKMYKE